MAPTGRALRDVDLEDAGDEASPFHAAGTGSLGGLAATAGSICLRQRTGPGRDPAPVGCGRGQNFMIGHQVEVHEATCKKETRTDPT